MEQVDLRLHSMFGIEGILLQRGPALEGFYCTFKMEYESKSHTCKVQSLTELD